jgi:ADP-L-glycero-D-manno-heptose 6-epimerase
MIVVTGGAGFIGSNLAAALDERGAAVAIVDRLGHDDKWRNLAKRELAAIVPPEALFDHLDANRGEIDAILHMGAVSSTVETDADLISRNNFTLSQDIWRWCARHKVRLIYASSAATYGAGDAGFDDVWHGRGAGGAAAAQRLWLVEAAVRPLGRRQVARGETPPQWAGLKFFNVYGPNEYHKGAQRSVAHQVFEKAAAGAHAPLFRSHRKDYADGGQLRDFVWVGDIVAMMLFLLDRPDVSGLFNAGSGKARSFADLAASVFAALGRPTDIRYRRHARGAPPELSVLHRGADGSARSGRLRSASDAARRRRAAICARFPDRTGPVSMIGDHPLSADFDPFAIAIGPFFGYGPLAIRWYALAYITGLVARLALLRRIWRSGRRRS